MRRNPVNCIKSAEPPLSLVSDSLASVEFVASLLIPFHWHIFMLICSLLVSLAVVYEVSMPLALFLSQFVQRLRAGHGRNVQGFELLLALNATFVTHPIWELSCHLLHSTRLPCHPLPVGYRPPHGIPFVGSEKMTHAYVRGRRTRG